MARIVSFSVFRGAGYATTRNYFSEEGRIQDRPASELPENEPPIKRRKGLRASHVALSGFMSGRIGEPIRQDYSGKVAAFEGGAEL